MSIAMFLLITALVMSHGAMWLRVGSLRFLPLPLWITLALPVGTLANVLVIFVYTIIAIPLTITSIGVGHVLGIALALGSVRLCKATPTSLRPAERAMQHVGIAHMMISIACVLILGAIGFYAAAHTLILPSFQYDSATNWTMRSRLSYEDQKMAFDPTELRGMAKPQYPLLFHALQVTANQGQAAWSDRIANTILFFLCVSICAASFLMLRMLRGTHIALLGMVLVTGTPLLTFHLGQGYGDIVLVEYAMLSVMALGLFIATRKQPWLILSAVCTSAMVWTKSEGLFFGLAPWALVVLLLTWKHDRRALVIAAVTSALLSLPWPMFLIARGLSFTPHQSSDTRFGLQWEGIKELPAAIFARGSFGPLWFVLPAAILYLLWLRQKKDPHVDERFLPLLWWGTIVVLETIFIYTCTPNVTFLLNAQSFYRQLLTPAALLILTCAMAFVPSGAQAQHQK